MASIERINTGDYTKQPFSARSMMDQRGVIDYGNLLQFAPYEGGYQFLSVINGPAMMNTDTLGDGRKDLLDAFIKVLEQEFKGLDGIEGISTDTMDLSDNISTLSLISKTIQNTNANISMRYTEKAGGLMTKFISTYLRYIKDSRTQAKTYGGLIGFAPNQKDPQTYPGFHMEVFNMLYIVTDSTCYNVEKAFLLLNAQPTSADFDSLYSGEKGDIGIKEISIPWIAYLVDGKMANKMASEYLRALINSTENYESGKININSWNYNYSFSNQNGVIKKVGDLTVDPSTGGYNS